MSWKARATGGWNPQGRTPFWVSEGHNPTHAFIPNLQLPTIHFCSCEQHSLWHFVWQPWEIEAGGNLLSFVLWLLGVHKVLETLGELVSPWICKQNDPEAPRVSCHEWSFYKNYPIQLECHSYLNDPLYVKGLILGIESRAHTLAQTWQALYHRHFPLLCLFVLFS